MDRKPVIYPAALMTESELEKQELIDMVNFFAPRSEYERARDEEMSEQSRREFLERYERADKIARERAALLKRIEAARLKLHDTLNSNEWRAAKQINRTGGVYIGPWRHIAAVSIGPICHDGETNAPKDGWYAVNGKFYVHNSWFRYRKINLDREPLWMLESILRQIQ